MNNMTEVKPACGRVSGKGCRIAFLTEYDGTDFSGFQIQNNGRSIQQSLENALEAIFGESCRVYGCSRTDAGVHARGHVSHADVPFCIPDDKLPLAMNANLPEDICVLSAKMVHDQFHARFDSQGKRYIYRISNSRMKPCIDRRFVAHVPGRLDLPLMCTAAEKMLGEKDFAAFCAQSDKKVCTIRNIRQIHVQRSAESGIIDITVEGKSFLYNMVRIIAGTLVSVGQGKTHPDQIEGIFALGDRRMAGKTMPARGLTLEKVFYDPEVF